MLFDFGGRRIEQELMDEASEADARACLENLVRLNRNFGGHSTLRQLLVRAGLSGESFSMLDVGAASGDSCAVIHHVAPQATVVSLDYNAVNLNGAPHPKLLANAFQLPFDANSFDYVLSTLFLHHFTNEQIVCLLRSFAQVARRGVLISDLERHLIPYLFLPATKRIFNWHWMAVHDGKLSFRAALTAGELEHLGREAGLQNIRVAAHRPAFRITMMAEV